MAPCPSHTHSCICRCNDPVGERNPGPMPNSVDSKERQAFSVSLRLKGPAATGIAAFICHHRLVYKQLHSLVMPSGKLGCHYWVSLLDHWDHCTGTAPTITRYHSNEAYLCRNQPRAQLLLVPLISMHF